MEKKKYPEVRFDGFNNQWNRTKLGNACLVTMGQSPNGENYSNCQLDHILVQGNADLKNGHVLPRVYTSQITKKANKGDIILTVRAPVGATAITDYDVVLGRGVAALKGNRFIYYTLQLIDQLGIWERYSSGSTFDSISSSDIKNLDFFNTDCEEQDSIGDFFQNLDQSIALHEKKLAQTQNFKKATLEKMFPKQGSLCPEIRLKGFSGDWEKKKLENEVEFFSGLTYSPNDITDKNGTLVLRSSNVHDNQIVTENNVYVDNEAINVQNVEVGDIIVVVRNGSRNLIGKHAVINEKMENTVIGAFMTGVKASNPYFINALFDTNLFDVAVSRNLGATINQITTGMFKEMEFSFPNEDEQIAIGQFFQKIDETCLLLKQQLQTVKNLKQALLAKMFV